MIKLKVAINYNPKLLEKFDNDKDFDVVIKCKGAEFRLQMAFLYLESEYFDQQWHQESKLVELHNLNRRALEQVLRVLYGGVLEINDIRTLEKVFEVVSFLKIASIKERIGEELRAQLQHLNSIELIEFLYQNSVLIAEVEETLVATDLEILRDPKHAIELNRLSNKVLNVILLDYLKKTPRTDTDRVKEYVNEVLADYFHANKKRAEDYFSLYNIDALKEIWFEAHPTKKPSTLKESETLLLYQRTIKNLSERIHELKDIADERKEKIKRLTQLNSEMKAKSSKAQDQPTTSSRVWDCGKMYESTIVGKKPDLESHCRFVANEPVSLSSTYESVDRKNELSKKISFGEMTLSSLFFAPANRKRSG